MKIDLEIAIVLTDQLRPITNFLSGLYPPGPTVTPILGQIPNCPNYMTKTEFSCTLLVATGLLRIYNLFY